MKFPAWLPYALGSAAFAALTAFFGKLGVASVNSNLATFVRTLVILALIAGVLSVRGEWKSGMQAPASAWIALVLSGLAAGASWLCYFRALQLGPMAKVAPVDKLSIVIAIALGVLVLGEPLTWRAMLGGALIVVGAIALAFA